MEPHDSGDKITLGYLLLCLDQLEFRVRFEILNQHQSISDVKKSEIFLKHSSFVF